MPKNNDKIAGRNKIKNLKISERHHGMLKTHCNKNALKMFHFIEKLIEINCKKETDIYGDD